MKEFEGKIQLEYKLIGKGYNRVPQKVNIFRQGFCKGIVLNGNHKIVYQHFEVIKSIWGGTPNVEAVPLGIDSIIEDNCNFNQDSPQYDGGES